MIFFFFFSSRRRHTMCALVTGVQTCALPIYAGIEVVLLDRDISTAEKGKAYSSKVLGKLLEKGVTNQDKADALLARITPTDDFAQLEGCDLIVEAVFEEIGRAHV